MQSQPITSAEPFAPGGCHSSFYRSRCVVCEGAIRRKTEWQKTCIAKACKAETRRFPLAYSWPETTKTANPPSDASRPPSEAHFTGIGKAIKAEATPLWEADLDIEHQYLFGDRLLARIRNPKKNKGTRRPKRRRPLKTLKNLGGMKSLETAQEVMDALGGSKGVRLACAKGGDNTETDERGLRVICYGESFAACYDADAMGFSASGHNAVQTLASRLLHAGFDPDRALILFRAGERVGRTTIQAAANQH